MARIKVADLRRIEELRMQGEISYSRGVEMLNEIASNYSELNNYENMPNMRTFYEFAKMSEGFDDFMVKLARPHEQGQNNAFKEANEILRSLHSVVERKGLDTNWETLQKRLNKILAEQHKIMYHQ